MFDSIFFFTYIFAAFVGCLAILLVVLLAKHWSSGNKKLLAAIRNFMICTALIDALYFYMEYYFLKNAQPLVSPVLRTIDILLFIGQVYFWAAYIREKGQLADSLKNRMQITASIGCGICIVCSFICYAFLMNDYYFVNAGIERTLAVSFEVVTGIILTTVTVWHLAKGLPDIVQKKIRNIVSCISIMITCNGVWNAILVVKLMAGDISPLEESIIDPTSAMIFLTNVLTIVLVYQEDFSSMFRAGGSAAHELEVSEPASRLDFLAEVHGLTQREREVMELAYEGLTNPEIAEELVISKYTVKRHMHNLFEKLDISTRIELVHLVDHENGPGGSL